MIKSRKVKIGIAAAAVIVIALGASSIFGKKGGQPMPMAGMEAEPPVVKTMEPYTGNISLTTGLTGTIEPSDVVHIYAKAGGDVTAVMVKAGDTVTQGQVLCEIDTEQVESAKNSMDAAALSMTEAQNTLNRMQILYASGDLSAQEYEQYANAAESSRLQYESAKLSYDRAVEYSTITAPISGKVESCDVEVYDNVNQGAQLCVISGEGRQRVSFYVTQRMMDNLALGDALEIEKNGVTYQAYISEISSMVDDSTGLFKVKAELEEAGGIATGSTVKLDVVTSHAEDTMLIPVDAIYYSGGDGYVYVYRDGKAEMVQVEVGLYDSENAQILSGLSMDDMVISTWSSDLYEGATVQLRQESEGETAALEGAEAQGGEAAPQETAASEAE